MVLRATTRRVVVSLLFTFAVPVAVLAFDSAAADASRTISAANAPATTAPASTVPTDTVNEFLPDDRSLGECISAIPKPGCGSEARGGWRQGLVAGLLVAALAIVGWRIVVGVRRPTVSPSRTPDATTAPAGRDGAPAP